MPCYNLFFCIPSSLSNHSILFGNFQGFYAYSRSTILFWATTLYQPLQSLSNFFNCCFCPILHDNFFSLLINNLSFLCSSYSHFLLVYLFFDKFPLLLFSSPFFFNCTFFSKICVSFPTCSLDVNLKLMAIVNQWFTPYPRRK